MNIDHYSTIKIRLTEFCCKTNGDHIIEVMAGPEIHTLTLTDNQRESLTVKDEIMGIKKKEEGITG